MNGSSVDVVWDPQTQMSSLDCWDYSIELACLQGPEGRGKSVLFLRELYFLIDFVEEDFGSSVGCLPAFKCNFWIIVIIYQ